MEFGFELQTEGASTMDITTIGFDLAKTVFQVHGADGEGRPVLRRKRAPREGAGARGGRACSP